ncbi:MAG: ABC transporter permease [Rubrobacter sp.]
MRTGSLYSMTRVEMKLFLREPAAVFFTLAFPTLALLLFGSLFGGYEVPGSNLRSIDLLTPGYTAMVIGTVAIIGLPTTIASYRQNGVLRRLRATPIKPQEILGAHVLVNLAATLLGIALLFVVGFFVFDLRMPGDPISVLATIVLASLSFFAFGFALSSLMPSVRVASAVGQVIFFPMIALSGAWVPREQFPDWLFSVSNFIPLTYAVNLVRDLWVGEGWTLLPVAILVGLMVVSVFVSSRTFRWE